MDRLQELRLAIFEKELAGEISAEDREILLEAADEKYSVGETEMSIESLDDYELTDFDMEIIEAVVNGDMELEDASDLIEEAGEKLTPNKEFKNAIKEATREYKELLGEIKYNVKLKKYSIAKAKIAIAKIKLTKLEKIVKELPSDLTDDLISILETDIRNVLNKVSLAIIASIILLVKDAVKHDGYYSTYRIQNSRDFQVANSVIAACGISLTVQRLMNDYKGWKKCKSTNELRNAALATIENNKKALDEILVNVKAKERKDKK